MWIERLDLALFVHQEHQRSVGRIKIETTMSCTSSTKCLSFDSLNVFTRCDSRQSALNIGSDSLSVQDG